MSLVDNYRVGHIQFLERSLNCTEGYTWVWIHVAQCLEHVYHVLGFASGLLAICFCAVAHTSVSITRSRDQDQKRNLRLSSVMYWLSEVLSLFGAVMSTQLSTQILYSIIMVPVYSTCCTYIFIKTSSKQNQNHIKAKSKRKSFLGKCMYPLYILLPGVMLIVCENTVSQMSARNNMFEDRIPEEENGIPTYRLLGYIFGIMSGMLLVCVRALEILYVYSSFEYHRCYPIVYMTGITGSCFYVFSVSSQSMSTAFMYHTVPWTLPRLIIIGIDIGIFIQRILQHRRTKQRRLSEEYTRNLLSSDGVYDEGSETESEEIIWMPLKIVETVQPQNSPNIQILTMSESSFDSQDLSVSKAVPDITVVPCQASLPEDNNDDDDERVVNELVQEEQRGLNLEETCNENEAVDPDCDQSEENILEHNCSQANTLSDTSASSIDSDNIRENDPFIENNNCTKDTIASLGSVTTVEKIQSWITTSN
ncbi:hypothetical protein ACF0H5_019835 [Mactra antiquata]